MLIVSELSPRQQLEVISNSLKIITISQIYLYYKYTIRYNYEIQFNAWKPNMKNMIVDVNSTNDMIFDSPSCVLIEVDQNTISLMKSTLKLILDHALTSASFYFGTQCIWSDYIGEIAINDRTDTSYQDDIAAITNSPVAVGSCEAVVTEQGFFLRATPSESDVSHFYESALIGFNVLDNDDRYVDALP